MPIRFRCVYCNTLLSIATRKAGTVINCPTCQKPLIVPNPETQQQEPPTDLSAPRTVPSQTPKPTETKTQTRENLFERDDFEKILAKKLDPVPVPTQTQRANPKGSPQPDVLNRPGTEIPSMSPPGISPKPWLPAEPVSTVAVCDVELVPVSSLQIPPPKGIILSPIKLILLLLFLVGLLSLIFVLGFYVGRATVPKPVSSEMST